MHDGDRPPVLLLEDARREAERFRRMAEETGLRRLREAEDLSRLLERTRLAERQLEQARVALERRVAERTAELTAANAHLSQEVAERERAEAALRASEEAFRSFVSHFPGLAYIKEADTTIVFASEGFRTHLGMDPAALVGRTNAESFPEPFASQITRDDLAVLESGLPAHLEEAFAGRRWSTHKFVIPGAGGARRLGGFTLDVTEMRQVEEERRRLERQVEQAQRMESLGILAGGIAHDFNNLLTSILGNLAFLRAGGGDAGDDCLGDVESAARAAAALCQQLLSYAGRAPLTTEPVALGALLADMQRLLRAAVNRRLSLQLEVAEPLPPVLGDPTQLRQVLMNLVINAAEAIGDADGAITLRAVAVHADAARLGAALLGAGRPEGEYAVLEVADTGCGMDAATQQRIFEPFFSSKFAGRGLGLSAVLGIVRQLGGAIEVESAAGRGTRFRVLLPALPAAAGAGAGAPAVTDRDAPPPLPAAGWPGQGPVLVVDDDQALRRVAGRALRHLGLTALHAESGAHAVELLAAARGGVRAVLLDLTMPGLDGVATLQRLRALDPQVRVVVASGHAAADVAERFRAAPPQAFLRKPYTVQDLAGALGEALRAGALSDRRGR